MAENDALVGILADNSDSLFSSVSGATLTEVPTAKWSELRYGPWRPTEGSRWTGGASVLAHGVRDHFVWAYHPART
jgi:hypothetical protein